MLGQLDEQDVERSAGHGEWRPPDEYLVCEAHHMLKYQVGSVTIACFAIDRRVTAKSASEARHSK